jgi:DMSO/TMAO reductase YedYZ heme-binding membrane subunit
MAALVSGVIVIVLVLSMTSQGHVIDAAVQRFMLYYAGVFALIGLTTSVAVGLVATDRIFLKPGHRVMAQAVHRAVSYGALSFLVIHIVTEILAQRVHVIDSVVPFLSPFRTFYIGLGTIASDLIVLLVITSILRNRFTAHGKAWRWRAIHYTAYVSFVFGVLHGLLGGRTGKAYVDWSYGFAIALTALGVAVRYFALSQRKKEELSAPPAGPNSGASSPLHAATLTMAQAQLGGTIQALPAYSSAGSWTATALAAPEPLQLAAGPGYGDGGFPPLGAPPYGDDMAAYPYQQPALATLPAPSADGRQPLYEPGYVGPPRYQGAPRDDGPQQDTRARGGTGPVRRALAGPMPSVDSGPMPRLGTGPMPRLDSGPMPRLGTGPMPRLGTGPMPRAATGPMPRLEPTGKHAAPGQPSYGGTGPTSAMGTGPLPAPPGMSNGPRPRGATGPMPAAGPMPTAGSPLSGPAAGSSSRGTAARPGPAPAPGPATGPMRAATGPMPRVDPGPAPRGGTGPMRPPAPDDGRRRRPPGEPRDGDRSRRGGGAWR